MSYRIPEALIGEENARLAAAQADDYAALGRRLRRAGVDIEAITAQSRRVRGRRADLGGRNRRHALRPLSRTRRTARHLRQA